MAGQDISILSFAARSAFSASVSGRDSTDSFCSIEFLSRSSNDSGFEEPDEELRVDSPTDREGDAALVGGGGGGGLD